MIEERPVHALAHRHRHLDQPQPVADDHHGRLDLGVVVRVVGGEERDRAPVQRLEAGGRVGHALAHEQRDDPREEADADAARARRTLLCGRPAKREPTTMSASPASTGSTSRGDLARVVLAVAVEPHGELEAVLERVAEAGLHGAADPEVERAAGRTCARRPPRPRRVPSVEPSSIDDDVEAGVERAHLARRRRRSRPPRSGPGRSRSGAGLRAECAAAGALASSRHAATGVRPTRSSSRRARCAYVCSSRTRSRARAPISSACAGSASSSR